MGAHSLTGNDIVAQIKKLTTNNLTVDHTNELYNRIQNAGSILYIGDNAGEIVFDKLFIETINHPNITFAVRGYPVINDITADDAVQTGIDKLCTVIA